jgi:hypothetical protein
MVTPMTLRLLLFLSLWTAVSCRQGEVQEKVWMELPQPGARYSLSDGEGGYRVAKVLGVQDEAIVALLFGDRWTRRPSLGEARNASRPIAVGYAPGSFTEMRPVHLDNGTVTAEENSAYETWTQGTQEIF